ncbi:hypothetical protein FA13DRAFT_1738874 [Coprinellus micaceus]|uniref:Uncharacterized protein n=1 Tax=Coprinellus micaceus TaxID=71717 RepID=A0A4Y7SST5_COPMI|nr:hypothetical protein FA13DRAFT_1738874 [Coprinellus micaceus]
MPRITRDPTAEAMPDFESDAFSQLFTPLATAEKPLEDIIADAKSAWEEQHRRRVEQWEEQVRADKEAQEHEDAEKEAEIEEQRRAQEEAERLERAEKEKKRPKVRPIALERSIDTTPSVMNPSQYAVNKVRNLEPAEIWYWTVEGCEDAKNQDTSASSSAMTLAQGEHGLIFTPAAAHKPSPKVKADANLTYSQMMIGKAGLIQSMLKEPNWPSPHVNSFARLFLVVDNHPLRRLPHGEDALVTYVAEARKEWHDALKSTDDTQEAFNISILNEERLNRIHTAILRNINIALLSRSVIMIH